MSDTNTTNTIALIKNKSNQTFSIENFNSFIAEDTIKKITPFSTLEELALSLDKDENTIHILSWILENSDDLLQLESFLSGDAPTNFKLIIIVFCDFNKLDKRIIEILNNRVIDKLSFENYDPAIIAEEMVNAAITLTDKFAISSNEQLSQEAKLLDEINEELRIRNSWMEKEKEIVSIFDDCHNTLEEKVISAIEMMSSFLHIEFFSLYINTSANADDMQLQLLHSNNPNIKSHQITSSDEWSATYVFYNKKILNIADFTQENRVEKNKHLPEEIKTTLSFPIILNDQIWGIGELYNKSDRIAKDFTLSIQKLVSEIVSSLQHKMNIYLLQKQVSSSRDEIQDILNNVGQAILTVNSLAEINSEYSIVSEEILIEKNLHKKNVVDLLMRDQIGDQIRIMTDNVLMKEWIKSVFTMSENWELLRDIGINDFCKKTANTTNGEQYLSVKYHPILKNNKVEKLMITINNVTAEKVAQKQLQEVQLEQENKNEILREVLNLDPNVFLDYIEDCTSRLKELTEIIEPQHSDSKADSELFLTRGYTLVHDLKGLANYVGLTNISKRFHYCEDQLRELIKWNKGEEKGIVDYSEIRAVIKKEVFTLKNIIEELQKMIKTISKNSSLCDWDAAIENEFELDIFNTISIPPSTSITIPRLQTFKELKKKRLLLFKKNIIQKYNNKFLSAIKNISSRMEKDVLLDLKISLNVPLKGLKLIEDLTIPLLINSIDHGIEIPSNRIEQQKNPQGLITLKVDYQKEKRMLELLFSDDGKGIDIQMIKKSVINKGIISEDKINSMSVDEILKLILLPNFSTKEQATQYSGRGIGLDIVKQQLDKLGGNLTINSIPSKGTTFKLNWTI
ncbi:MAG: hypothetical protein HQK49_18315 [Oligoflexia bacterium]|nr:hypothetical protein [Oligoflexia bacterium]